MVLLYMVTWIPSIYPLYVSIYTSTMEHMGMDIKWIITWIITWIIKWIINGWILWPSTPMINVSGCNWMIIGIWIGEWPHYNWDLSWFITPGIANPMAHLSRDGRRGWGWGMLFVWYNIHIIYTYIYDIHTYIYMIYIYIYISTNFRHGSHGHHPGGARTPDLAKTTCAAGVQDEVLTLAKNNWLVVWSIFYFPQ
jgi:hypothetical protein